LNDSAIDLPVEEQEASASSEEDEDLILLRNEDLIMLSDDAADSCSIIFNDEFSYRNFCDLELDILSIGMDVMV
jgi:hypothetical protein